MLQAMRSFLLALLIAPVAFAGGPGLTIYNAGFAVVRESVVLDLKAGVNSVTYDGATLEVEPDSVILRDPAGAPIKVLEQTYRNDPVNRGLLLSLFEGRELDFFVSEPNKPDRTVRGRVVRSGYVPPGLAAPQGANEPLVEVDGTLRFGLPGEPLFPPLGGDLILKPRLEWKIASDAAAKKNAEVGYVTGGLSWEASYNILSPAKGDVLDLTGWITMTNASGRAFENAAVKLLAGDVRKLAPPGQPWARRAMMAAAVPDAEAVTSKAFDEFHLYALPRPVSLRDQETKQVEFLRVSGVRSKTLYIFDGSGLTPDAIRGTPPDFRRVNPEFGTGGRAAVEVVREFKNTAENNLGIPLPAGRVRFYRADGEQLEFVGENEIGHTPADETVRLATGTAFDIVAERKQADFQVDEANRTVTETFEIALRNRKKDAVQVRVVERLYRGTNWTITEKGQDFEKVGSDEIRFLVDLKPGDERTLAYTVRYTW